jgi:hypothetical protein
VPNKSLLIFNKNFNSHKIKYLAMPELPPRKRDMIVSWYMLQDKDDRGFLFPGNDFGYC